MLDRGEHQVINDFLMSPGQVAQLRWQGKGDQEVSGRQPFFQLIVDPLLTFMVLAMRAASMAAGMRDIDSMAAMVITAGPACEVRVPGDIWPWPAALFDGLAGRSYDSVRGNDL